jgi:hypothetical protein
VDAYTDATNLLGENLQTVEEEAEIRLYVKKREKEKRREREKIKQQWREMHTFFNLT